MAEISQWNDKLRSLVAWIGNTSLFGVTLDIPAHFFGGLLIFWLLRRAGLRFISCWAILMLLELFKEIYDLSALLHHGDVLEPIKDMVVTMIGAGAAHLLLTRKRPSFSHGSAMREKVNKIH